MKEALDLCLACKGCKGECPVRVDMATYKAEFLAHYYEGRVRPRHAYAFGLVAWWARLGSLVPWTANRLARAPGLERVAKWAAGLAPVRRIPSLAPQTFRARVARRRPPGGQGPRVLLWPDTFTNYFHPEVGEAAVEVLERGGWRVDVPRTVFCCGRPLYDYGMLARARRWLRHTLAALEEDIRSGTPLIVLEPSCASVFRDELLNLFPDDERAGRLAGAVHTFGEFLDRHERRFRLPRLERRALVQGHCHQKALADMDSDERVLRSMGVEPQVLDAGCCGMAGAFGFQAEHYEVSARVGERRLLPAVRQADPATFIVADGFSCREQIAQMTGRRALHLAEVAALAYRPDLQAPAPHAESALVRSRPRHGSRPRTGELVMAGGGLAAAALAGAGLARLLGHSPRTRAA